jgi:hypothetical protein
VTTQYRIVPKHNPGLKAVDLKFSKLKPDFNGQKATYLAILALKWQFPKKYRTIGSLSNIKIAFYCLSYVSSFSISYLLKEVEVRFLLGIVARKV